MLSRLLKVDGERFEEACRAVVTGDHARYNIGTYREKSLHLVLKRYFQPNTELHEIKIGRFVADAVLDDHTIIEIQTSGFGAMRRKLEDFLKEFDVYLLYPIAETKYVSWIDENGEVGGRHKSPKKGWPSDVLPELLYLASFVGHPHFHLYCAMLDVEEFRLLDGWGQGGKRGSSRYDRVPTGLNSFVPCETAEEIKRLLPSSLPTRFDSETFGKKLRFIRTKRWAALRLLQDVGLVIPDGKEGRRTLYRLV